MTSKLKAAAIKALKISAFAVVLLVSLIVLAGAVVSYSSRRDWAAEKARLLAKGEKLSLAEFIPPTVPDEENFFGDPMWKQIESGGADYLPPWNQPLSKEEIEATEKALPGIVMAKDATRIDAAWAISGGDRPLDSARARVGIELLQPLGPLSEKITRLLERPHARYPVAYEKGFYFGIEHLAVISSLSRFFNSRARLEIALGESDTAAKDVFRALKLVGTLKDEPLLVSQLASRGLASAAYAIIEEGIGAHVWSEEQLLEFERSLLPWASPDGMTLALRGERAMFNSTIEKLQAGQAPDGSTRQGVAGAQFLTEIFVPANVARYNRQIQSVIDSIDAAQGGSGISTAAINRDIRPEKWVAYYLRPIEAGISLSLIRNLLHGCERAKLVMLSCALERFRISAGEYPGSLAELVPRFIEKLPATTLSDQSFQYKKVGEGFLVWTPGWNEVDDGGKASWRNKSSGDWISNPFWNWKEP